MTEGSESRELNEGSVLAGRYRILRRLGEGAMGAVYLAEHLQIGRHDAIKVLRSALASDQEAIARFLRGTRNVSQVRHPNVCAIYDFAQTEDGTRFLAMEYVAGPTLKEVLDREDTLTSTRAIELVAQTADALQAAHEAGVVHRDLKPGNIMIVTGANGREIVKVVDFDIAKGPEGGEELTQLGFVVGTPEYMSPEQLTGERLDGRSDVYSLGLVLFRTLTGMFPFEGNGPQELMVARLTSDPTALGVARPDLAFPAGLQSVLDRALARKVSDRHSDAARFAQELRDVAATRATDDVTVPATRIVPGAPAASVREPRTIAGDGHDRAPSRGVGWPARKGLVVAIAAGTMAVIVLAFLLIPSREPVPDTGGSLEVVATGQMDDRAATATGVGDDATGLDAAADRDGSASGSDVEAGGLPTDPPGDGPDESDVTSPSGSDAGSDEPALPDAIRFASSAAIDAALLAIGDRVIDLDSPPSRAALGPIRDTLIAGIDQAEEVRQRRSAARLLAFVDFHLGDADGCRRWTDEVARMGGSVPDLESLCARGLP